MVGPAKAVVWPTTRELCDRLAPWLRVHQEFDDHAHPDPIGTLSNSLRSSPGLSQLNPGSRVAVAVGSRGIARLPELVSTTISTLREIGMEPFVVPAMGSHGGGTAAGQRETLAALGITEDLVGAPIVSETETVVIGTVDEVAVNVNSVIAGKADAIIPVARIKPHTDFRGPIESGVLKMLGIGLGSAAGADALHTVDPDDFSHAIELVGRFLLERLPVVCAVGVVEDAFEHLGIVEVLEPAVIPDRERELLKIASAWLPRLPCRNVDLLIVRTMGKDVSGTGMDTNVTGRFYRPREDAALKPRILVVLGLTEQTNGNAAGIGMADVTTREAVERIDWHTTYFNEITARMLSGARMPLVAENDEEAIGIALHTLGKTPPEEATIACIDSTREVSTFFASEPLWSQMRDNSRLTVDDTVFVPQFDDGHLIVAERGSAVR